MQMYLEDMYVIKKLKETLMYSRVEKAVSSHCVLPALHSIYQERPEVVRLCLTVLKNFLGAGLRGSRMAT